jgi:hypothetical protein
MTSHERADYYSPQAGSGQNPLDTCGAIKERRTAFPAPNKELAAKPKNNRLTGKAPYKSRANLIDASGLGASRMSSRYAVTRGTDVIFEGKADRVPQKLPSNLVEAREPRACQTGSSSSREASVREQRKILYRHARSRKRDDSGQPALPIGQANEPITARPAAGDPSSLNYPNSVGQLGGGRRSRRFHRPHRRDCCK